MNPAKPASTPAEHIAIQRAANKRLRLALAAAHAGKRLGKRRGELLIGMGLVWYYSTAPSLTTLGLRVLDSLEFHFSVTGNDMPDYCPAFFSSLNDCADYPKL